MEYNDAFAGWWQAIKLCSGVDFFNRENRNTRHSPRQSCSGYSYIKRSGSAKCFVIKRNGSGRTNRTTSKNACTFAAAVSNEGLIWFSFSLISITIVHRSNGPAFCCGNTVQHPRRPSKSSGNKRTAHTIFAKKHSYRLHSTVWRQCRPHNQTGSGTKTAGFSLRTARS